MTNRVHHSGYQLVKLVVVHPLPPPAGTNDPLIEGMHFGKERASGRIPIDQWDEIL
jgi:hypothetical protein